MGIFYISWGLYCSGHGGYEYQRGPRGTVSVRGSVCVSIWVSEQPGMDGPAAGRGGKSRCNGPRSHRRQSNQRSHPSNHRIHTNHRHFQPSHSRHRKEQRHHSNQLRPIRRKSKRRTKQRHNRRHQEQRHQNHNQRPNRRPHRHQIARHTWHTSTLACRHFSHPPCSANNHSVLGELFTTQANSSSRAFNQRTRENSKRPLRRFRGRLKDQRARTKRSKGSDT